MFGSKRIQFFQELLAHDRGVFDQLFAFQHLECREPAGHREVIATKRAGVNDRPVQPAEHFLIDGAPGHDRAAGNESLRSDFFATVMMSGSRSQC